ncbi:MAG: A/G-specific adenine glycosylase [Actinomycetia bacterium]|nr:A/G-specific adenine glycosylase [Actinomycetes bacterium]
MIEAITGSDRNTALIKWYGNEARNLPWRVFGDPYLTLVSEAMLQQTQVDRVIPKFEAFIDTWPTVEGLARASTNQLLAIWSGLGYNSRALRLRESARIIADGGWPTSVSGLQELPGVGPYTAAAIASIAFGVDVPAIDTNLKRVLSRWHGEPLSGKLLEEFAVGSIASPAGLWNQAVMDLGATICRPTNPACGDCPISRWCADPTVYEPPVKQSRFKGSRRELRGALVRASVSNGDLYAAGEALGRSDTEISETITALRTEGLVD